MTTNQPQSSQPTLQEKRLADYEHAYDEYIRENYGEFELLDKQVSATEIAKKMLPEVYQRGLADFVNSEIEHLLEEACEKLPSPIAHALHSALYGSENENQKLGHFRDACEAFAVVLLALVMGECRKKNLNLDAVQIIRGRSSQSEPLKRKHLRSENVADRLAVVEGVLSWAATNGVQLECNTLIPIPAVQKLREMHFIRNEVAHTQTLSEDEAKPIAEGLRTDFEEVLRTLPRGLDITCARFKGLVVGKPNTAKLESLCGHARSRTIDEMVVPQDSLLVMAALPTAERIIVRGGSLTVDGAPYLYSKNAAGANASQVLLFKVRKLNPAAVVEFDVSGASSVEPLPTNLFDADFNALDGLLTV